MWKRREKARPASSPHPAPTMLEWSFPSDEEAWESSVAQPSDAPTGQAAGLLNRRRLQAISALLIVLLLGVSLYLWGRAERSAQMLEAELRATIAAEAQPTQHLPSDQEKRDLAVPPIRVEAQEITFQREVVSVLVESTHTDPDGSSYIVRQRRFYRWTESGWVAVSPDSDILGSLQSYESDFFTFSYFMLDEANVQAVAAEIDTIYAQLRRDYALPPPAERMTIMLIIDIAKDEYSCYKRDHLCLSSPALAVLPDSFSESDVLRLWLLNALVYQVYLNATETKTFRYGWHDATIVLPHLQMRQHSALLSAWHTDLVRWLYGVVTRVPRPDADTLSQEVAHLCERHQIQASRDFFKGATILSLCDSPQMLNLWFLTNYKSPEQVGHLGMPDPDLRMTGRSWGGRLYLDRDA